MNDLGWVIHRQAYHCSKEWWNLTAKILIGSHYIVDPITGFHGHLCHTHSGMRQIWFDRCYTTQAYHCSKEWWNLKTTQAKPQIWPVNLKYIVCSVEGMNHAMIYQWKNRHEDIHSNNIQNFCSLRLRQQCCQCLCLPLRYGLTTSKYFPTTNSDSSHQLLQLHFTTRLAFCLQIGGVFDDRVFVEVFFLRTSVCYH